MHASTRPQTRDAIIAAVEAFRATHDRMPLPSDSIADESLPHKSFGTKDYAAAAGFPTWQAIWDHFGAGKLPQGRAAAKYRGTVAAARRPRVEKRVIGVPPPAPEPEPELPPAAEHAELVPVNAAPSGHASPLVRLLSQLATEDLEERFGFTVDVAASERNRKVDRFYSVEQDGLAQSWAGERVWCNPPYSNIGEWVEKAWAEADAELIAMLLPANRTEQGWWQDMVEPFRDRVGSPLTTEFFAGRLRFIAHDADAVGPNERPPFGCVLLVWNYEEARRVAA